MSGPDDEFDDFLSRRKPVFRRSTEDPFEPPEDLDRIVLRQAQEAIEADRPERVYHGPRWGLPVALAATLLLIFTVVLHVSVQNAAPVPEVSVQSISHLEYPVTASQAPAETSTAADAATAPMADLRAPAAGGIDSLAPGGFASEAEAKRYAPAPPPPPVASTASRADQPASAADAASSIPAWRRDAATWQAEIDRLRAEGKTAEADAEQAEFKRQHRAYAGSPDR